MNIRLFIGYLQAIPDVATQWGRKQNVKLKKDNMKFLLLFTLIILPLKEYIVLDIKDRQLNYVILLKDIKTQELFCKN